MEDISVNTKEMLERSKRILSSVNNSKDNLDSLFKELNDITNKQWVGNSAEEFVKRINIEKQEYYMLLDILEAYGLFLADSAVSYENLTSRLQGEL